jgi:transcriptional regulator with XRE-family HTH domain
MIRDEDREMAEAIGRRARGHRMRLGATQEQIAELVDLSPQVYARMERGGVLPSLRTLARMAEALATSPAELLADLGEAPLRESRKAKSGPGNIDMHAIQRYATALDPATRGHVVSLLKKLAQAQDG